MAPWAGFHTFRHTIASIHLSKGTNLLQLSRALGHHSPAFTLTRYTHLLPGDEAQCLISAFQELAEDDRLTLWCNQRHASCQCRSCFGFGEGDDSRSGGWACAMNLAMAVVIRERRHLS